MIIAYIAFVLSIPSFVLSMVIYRRWRKLQPTISRAMGIISSLGKKATVENKEIVEIEEALTDGVLDMVMQKYPEAGLVLAYLEENNPEIMEKIKSKPSIVIGLVNKYAPLIGQLVGKGAANKKLTYDA